MKKKVTFILFFVFMSMMCAGEEKCWFEKFIRRFEIRQDLDVEKSIAKPAFFTWTIAGDKKSEVIGIGLSYLALNKNNHYAQIFFDVQKNTLVEKKQNVFKYGLMFKQSIEFGKDGANGLVFKFMLNGKHDYVSLYNALQFSTYITFCALQRNPSKIRWLPNYPIRIKSNGREYFSILWMPFLGIEYENILQSSDPAKAKGFVWRGVWQFEGRVYPFPRKLGKANRMPLELFISYTGRKDIKTSNSEKFFHSLLKTGANFYFLKSQAISSGIGFTYCNGDDPINGFLKQKYTEISLKLKLVAE